MLHEHYTLEVLNADLSLPWRDPSYPPLLTSLVLGTHFLGLLFLNFLRIGVSFPYEQALWILFVSRNFFFFFSFILYAVPSDHTERSRP
jgi:hypothetical protein